MGFGYEPRRASEFVVLGFKVGECCREIRAPSRKVVAVDVAVTIGIAVRENGTRCRAIPITPDVEVARVDVALVEAWRAKRDEDSAKMILAFLRSWLVEDVLMVDADLKPYVDRNRPKVDAALSTIEL